jgi:PIN domain nuclease of toxin-antitoxin system
MNDKRGPERAEAVTSGRKKSGEFVAGMWRAIWNSREDLPFHHRDPFDRILIAQSIAEARQLLTSDRWILSYESVPGVRLLKV